MSREFTVVTILMSLLFLDGLAVWTFFLGPAAVGAGPSEGTFFAVSALALAAALWPLLRRIGSRLS